MEGFIFGVEGADLPEVLRALWRRFLDGGVGGIVVTMESEGGVVAPGIVSSADLVAKTRAFAPYMPVNTAGLLQRVTRLSPPSKVMVAVLRPCEAMATLELVKLNQVSRENLIILSMDCLGTYPFRTYMEFLGKGGVELPYPEVEKVREACKVCLNPVAPWADVRVGFVGVEGGIFLEPLTDEGRDFLSGFGFEVSEVSLEARERLIDGILSDRKEARNGVLEEASSSLKGVDKLLSSLSSCIRCLNCMEMCPVCYCKECFFRSQTFEMEGDRFLELSLSRGAARLPTDILLFHLTRMAHMAFSCVSCGMCQEACPKDVPVFRMFFLASQEVQDLFGYRPGVDPGDRIPVTTFREDEFREVED